MKIIYQSRLKAYEELVKKQTSKINKISNLRLLVFLSVIILTLLLYKLKLFVIMLSAVIVGIALFIWLALEHQKLFENREIAKALVNINIKSVNRVEHKWSSFSDIGEEFIDTGHKYTYDLDIFGKGSLFQWINSTVTYEGRQKLFELLSNPDKNISAIKERQEAIKELAKKVALRQKIEAEGIAVEEPNKNPTELLNWAEDLNEMYLKSTVKWFFRILPTITICLIALAFFNILPNVVPIVFIVLQLFLIRYKSKQRTAYLDTVLNNKKDIKRYVGIIKALESASFSSKHLIILKGDMVKKSKNSASRQIGRLFKLADSISNKYNILFYIINVLLLWDYQCLIRLETWKYTSGKSLKGWINAIGEIEALASLSIINFDNANWDIPKIVDGEKIVEASALGHPLLPNTRSCNDIKMDSEHPILIITGSNMSGKSTLLRTIGINLVLGYTGAAVCATNMTCSLMNIYSCMRVSDNLENSISSFYAEILRIKMIVGAVDKKEKVFFLLDEIFRGTNSLDRHTGAEILIRKLSNTDTLGLVSTHDLELGDLEEKSNGQILNFNFQEYYKNNEIFFDYKLNRGVSKTRNAAYLMRMAGIDI